MLMGAGLPGLAMILFNRLIKGLLLQMKNDPIYANNDDLHHKALDAYQRKNDKGKDTQKDSLNIISGAMVAVHLEDGWLWTHGVIVKPN